jgi:hypothetical protein
MKVLAVVLLAIAIDFSPDLALARGGAVSHSAPSVTVGGALGTPLGAPGTNSLGTALPTDLGNGIPMKRSFNMGPSIDRENAKIDKMIGSICRGC